MSGPRITITDAFEGRGAGVLVMPRFTAAGPIREPFAVHLRMPDGSMRNARATVEAAHLRGAAGSFAMYRVLDVPLAELLRGTELWPAD